MLTEVGHDGVAFLYFFVDVFPEERLHWRPADIVLDFRTDPDGLQMQIIALLL